MLLWLWRRPAATAPIGPLAWEPPHAMGAAHETAKRQKKKKKNCLFKHSGILIGMILKIYRTVCAQDTFLLQNDHFSLLF